MSYKRRENTKPPGRLNKLAPGAPTHWLPGVEGLRPSFFSLLPPMDCSSRLGTQRLRLPSLGNPVGSPSSPMWVLRVRSGRGPTFRTARRGTISTWLGQRDWPQLSDPVSLLPDQRAPEPLVASAPSPEFPFGLELKALLRRQVPTLPFNPRGINIGASQKRASADVSSG